MIAEKPKPFLCRIAGKTYLMRKYLGNRQVRWAGKWISHTDFVDELHRTNQFDVICELAFSGLKRMERRMA